MLLACTFSSVDDDSSCMKPYPKENKRCEEDGYNESGNANDKDGGFVLG